MLERSLGRWADNLQLDGAPATNIPIAREPDPAESGPQKTATRPRAGDRCFELYSTFVQEACRRGRSQFRPRRRVGQIELKAGLPDPCLCGECAQRTGSVRRSWSYSPGQPEEIDELLHSRRRKQGAPSKSRLCRHKTDICFYFKQLPATAKIGPSRGVRQTRRIQNAWMKH